VVLVFIALLVIPFSPVHKYYYPDVNLEAADFFIHNRQNVNDSENMLYSMVALDAPKSVEDIHAFGMNQVEAVLEEMSCLDAADDYGKSYFSRVENALKLDVDGSKLTCWLSKVQDKDDGCYTLVELGEVVKTNELLLKRYEGLASYEKFDANIHTGRNGQLLISLHKLYLANIRSTIQSDESINRLLKDLMHKRILLSQDGTWIEKAISLVIYGLSLNQLEYFLVTYPGVAMKYEGDINRAISDLSVDEFNVDGVFRKEFDVLNEILCLEERLGFTDSQACFSEARGGFLAGEEFVLNDFHNVYLEHKDIMQMGLDDMMRQCNSLDDWSDTEFFIDTFVHLPIFPTQMTYSLMLGGMLKACEMMANFKIKAAKLRQLRVYLSINAKGLEGESIKEYLETESERDLLTDLPFVYDNNKNSLEFPLEVSNKYVRRFDMAF